MVSGVRSSVVSGRSGNALGRWFDDRTVRSKILIAVGAVALAGVVAGFVGVSKLGTVYQAGDKVVTYNLVPAQSLADARIQVETMRIAVRDVFLLNGDGRAKALQQVADTDKIIDADIAAYQPMAADPSSIQQFQDEWVKYRQVRDAKALPAAQTNNLVVFDKALSEASPLVANAAALLATAAKAEQAQGLQTAATAKADYQAGRLQVILVLSIGTLLAWGLVVLGVNPSGVRWWRFRERRCV